MEASNNHPTNPVNKNSKEFYYGIGKDIVPGGIFERFPELIPYVGENYYSGNHKQLIFIGDSNYFEKELEAVSVFQDAKEWYTGNVIDKLIPENKKGSVKCAKGYSTLDKAFTVANDVLKNRGIKLDNDWLLNEAAFYNYFLRPALNPGNGIAKKFIPEPLDREVAGAALHGIIERLQPQIIVFLSKLAYNEFERYRRGKSLNYTDLLIERVSHPSSLWWNRNGGAYGKGKLERILAANWVL